MKLLSLDFELMGVFDKAFVKSWICEAAGGHPSDANGTSPATIKGQSNPWRHEDPGKVPRLPIDGEFSSYDALKAKLAAQNGLHENEHVKANRKAVSATVQEWIEQVSRDTETIWIGHNFRAHDWHFIKSLGVYNSHSRPAIIDTLELKLLLVPEKKHLALGKRYKTEDGKNCPVQDAKKACLLANRLYNRIAKHPLRDLLGLILLRDAEHSEWLSKDWQSVLVWQQQQGTTAAEPPPTAKCDEVWSKAQSVFRGKELNECQPPSGEADGADFKSKFCQYLDKEPFACAYFVCWLAKVQGTSQGGRQWEKGIGKFAPHPLIVQNYPAVLHLIRLYFAKELRNPPGTEDSGKPLTAWLHEFSSKAKTANWSLKGRWIEVPAAVKKGNLYGPTFGNNKAFGIHQADVIGRILGFDSKAESGRSDPTDSAFSPANIFVAPTGFGKSLCYQLPAFIMSKAWKALTLVISPLQAIQLDQVRGMESVNSRIRVLNTESYKSGQKDNKTENAFTVAFINSTLTANERAEIRQAVTHGECDMLFLAPEQLLNPSVVQMLSCRDIGLVALDEAHCLSSWGHAFRPEYMYVAKWLDRYCRERMRREENGLAPSGNQPCAPDEHAALSWSSYQAIKKKGEHAAFPRAALFTATLEPEATKQLQSLFLHDASDQEAADHIVGGYTTREEIKLEVETKTFTSPETLLKTAAELLKKPFFPDNPNCPPLQDLPVLLYSTTVRQTELIFGKPHFNRQQPQTKPEQLPQGLANRLNTSLKERPSIKDYLLDRVAIYHGRMEAAARREILDAFIRRDETPNIILCTSAFGMGVDRPDICAVIMLGMPASLNDLLQQAGRAARDLGEMAKTLGVPERGCKARAIVLANPRWDHEQLLKMAKRNAIPAGLLVEVWKEVRERHRIMKEMVEVACGPLPLGQLSAGFAFNPVDQCLAQSKIVISEESFREILGCAKTREAPSDETKELWLRQCFYWLEKLGKLERLPNPSRAPKLKLAPKLVQLDRKAAIADLKKDLETLFGPDGQGGWFPDYGIPRSDMEKWRKHCGAQRSSYAKAPGRRMEIVRQWTSYLRKQLAEDNSVPFCCEAKAPDELPGFLPLKSDAAKFTLWPLLIQKLKQSQEPEFLDLKSLKTRLEDVIAFLKNRSEDFEQPSRLFALLRKIGWIEDNQTFVVVVSEKQELMQQLRKLPNEVRQWLKLSDGDATAQFQGGSTSLPVRPLLGELLMMIGAITHADDKKPYGRVKSEAHVESVIYLLAELITSLGSKLRDNGPVVLKPSDLGEDIKKRVEQIRSFDPLFPHDAVEVAARFTLWLQDWQRDRFYIQDGSSKFAASYCIRVLQPDADLPELSKVEEWLSTTTKSAKMQLDFLREVFLECKGMRGVKDPTFIGYKNEWRAGQIPPYYDPTKSLNGLLEQAREAAKRSDWEAKSIPEQVEPIKRPDGRESPPTDTEKDWEVFYQIADQVPWDYFDKLSQLLKQPGLRDLDQLLDLLKTSTAEEARGLIQREEKWFVSKLVFDRAETLLLGDKFNLLKAETGIDSPSLAPLLAEPREEKEKKEKVRKLDDDSRRELLESWWRERKAKSRQGRELPTSVELPTEKDTSAEDAKETAARMREEIAWLGTLGFLHRTYPETPVMQGARGWRLREVAVQPGILQECRQLLATWPADQSGLGAHLKPFFEELLDRLGGAGGAWPERLSVFMVPATEKPGWLFCRERWDLFCQKCSAIERDTEEWKRFKKTLKQLWKEPREVTLKTAFVHL